MIRCVEFLEGRVLLHGLHGSAHDVHEPAPQAPAATQAAPPLYAPAGAAAQLLPDLTPLASQAAGERYLYNWTVDRASTPGRSLLRFTTAMANVGQGPLELRAGATHGGTQDVLQRVYASDGSTADRLAGAFSYHPEHGHTHVDDFARYTLRAAGDGGEVGDVLASSDKVSFCLLDSDRHSGTLPRSPAAPHYVTCDAGVQGISVGWADVYQKTLPGQAIDVTSVTAGEYWLEVTVDPEGQLRESDENNNTTRIRVKLEPANVPLRADRFEPNNAVATATDLGTLGGRVESGLSVHAASDVDFYKLIPASAGVLTVELSAPAGGDVDLALFDAAQAQVVESATDGPNERLTAMVSGGAVYYVRVSASGGATNPSYALSIDGPPPTVSVAAADPLAAEGAADAGAFIITRNGPTDVPLTVRYALSGSASAGADYEALAGSAVIPVLQTSVTVELRPASDAETEGDEQAVLTLSTSAEYAVAASARSAAVTIVDGNTSPLPAPWDGGDVGEVTLPGAALATPDGRFLVRGAGVAPVPGRAAGLGGAFQFARVPLAGDGAVVARLVAWDGAEAVTRAGVALRHGDSPGAAGVALIVAGDGTLLYEVRRADGGKPRVTAAGTVSAPTWLRITRAGRRVTASASADGVKWRTVGSTKLGGAAPDAAGLVSTSSDAARTSTAAFADAAVVSVPAAPAALAAAARGGRVELSWDDRATDETGYVVERATGKRRKFAALATLPADATAFTDSVVAKAGRRHFYRVRAYNGAGPSSPSTVASA